MKLILKIKTDKHSKKKRIVAWIKKNSEFDDDITQILKIFKETIKISKLSRIMRYYIITSEKPAIILNIFSTIQDILPEVYFYQEDALEVEDIVDI